MTREEIIALGKQAGFTAGDFASFTDLIVHFGTLVAAHANNARENVTMCASTTCDKRTECSRNAASGTAPNPYRQSYFVSTEMTEDGCPYYSPVHTRKYVTEERNAN
jgi:hypothetical protein